MSQRTLTDEDVAAVVDALCEKIKNEFYRDLGRGLWAFVWKALIAGMIGIDAWQGLKGVK